MVNIDFSCNVNPLGPPKGLLKKVDLEKIVSSYPDHTNQEAIKSVSSHYALPQENLTIGIGSTEFFFTIPDALDIGTGIVVVPTFWEYDTSLIRANKNVKYFKIHEEEGFHINFPKLRVLLSTVTGEKTNHALYLCQPNNPTSTLIDSKEILNLCEEFQTTKIIVDETYLLFKQNYDYLSLMKEVSEHSNLVVITSFSKFFTVPGVRIGLCCSSKENLEAIKKRQIPYGINNLALALIPYLLENHEFIRESREFMEDERRGVYQLAKESPHLHPYEPQANFMLVRLRGRNVNSTEVIDYLRQKGMIVRNGSEFFGLGDQYLRFSIRTREENCRLLVAINDYYNSRTKPS